MSSDEPEEPADRSPEELAAVLADLAAETDSGDAARPGWRPIGSQPPEIWAAPEDPLTRLHDEVARVETESPVPSPSPSVPATEPALPPLQRVSHVAGAWSTLRADRPGGRQPPRAKLLTGVIAAARERRTRRKTD